jgi:Ala-tRNA(Pro) deacylase
VSESDGARLSDGSAPCTAEELIERLDALDVVHETIRHEPVFTVEESKRQRGERAGGHAKNLFLRNKKGRMWLVVCQEDREIDLRALAEHVGARRFSFASSRRLMAHLGVVSGAVTPFSVVNDSAGLVQVVLDASLLEQHPLHFHPLDNAMTTSLGVSDLIRFLEAVGHRPEIVDLDLFEVAGSGADEP